MQPIDFGRDLVKPCRRNKAISVALAAHCSQGDRRQDELRQHCVSTVYSAYGVALALETAVFNTSVWCSQGTFSDAHADSSEAVARLITTCKKPQHLQHWHSGQAAATSAVSRHGTVEQLLPNLQESPEPKALLPMQSQVGSF